MTIVLFFVPSALIIAELGTAYPYQGGIWGVDSVEGTKPRQPGDRLAGS